MSRIDWRMAMPLVLGLMMFLPLPVFAAGELPEGEGHDLVQETCTVCHSSAIILQQGMTREKWDHTITWMQEKQGLWELEPKVRNGILDYLAKHMGPDRKSPGGGENRSRMYQYEYRPNPL